jgi:hypothetical protein
MGKYGETAKIAVALISENPFISPVDAWEAAVARVFPSSESSRKKSCPKGAFQGLCEEGMVAGVNPGNYTRSLKTKTTL